MTTCRFCTDTALGVNEFWNRPLVQSPNFTVLPSLGPLVEGWLMLIPKSHVVCLGALERKLVPEMQRMKVQLSSIVRQRFGNVCLFEHGPSAPNRSVGCTVDHAHLHILPLDFNLAAASEPFMPPGTIWEQANYQSCRDAFHSQQDYLYIEEPVGRAVMAKSNDFGSQTLRKAIAAQLGVPHEFNWRDYPNLDVLQRTVGRVMAAV